MGNYGQSKKKYLTFDRNIKKLLKNRIIKSIFWKMNVVLLKIKKNAACLRLIYLLAIFSFFDVLKSMKLTCLCFFGNFMIMVSITSTS